MLNIDTRLLAQVDESELWLLMQLAKRINKENLCWPSNRTLCSETGWHIEKLQRIKKQLMEKNLLSVLIRKHPEGGQGANAYQVNSAYIGVFVSADKFEFACTENGEAPSGKSEGGAPANTDRPSSRKNRQRSINQSEVLTNELIKVESIPERILKFFNEVRSKHGFTRDIALTPGRIKMITGWLKAKYAEADFHHVVLLKFGKWSRDPKTREWLTPETLFGEKFPKYVEEVSNQPAQEWHERDKGVAIAVDDNYPY